MINDSASPQEFTIRRRIKRHRFYEIERSDGSYFYFAKRLGYVVAKINNSGETSADWVVVEKLLNPDELVEFIHLIIFREQQIRKTAAGGS